MQYLISNEWMPHKKAFRLLRKRGWTADSIEAVFAAMARAAGGTRPDPEAPAKAKRPRKRPAVTV